MNIGKLLTERLRALTTGAATTPDLIQEADVRRLLVAADDIHVRLTLFDHDRYSVTMRAVDVSIGAPVAADARSYLSAAAGEAIRRLSFLEEPLAVWELDGDERLAQLRSSPPERDGSDLFFWEVTLSAGAQPSASITRYHWAPGMPERVAVAYPATFSMLARIADGLVAALRTNVE